MCCAAAVARRRRDMCSAVTLADVLRKGAGLDRGKTGS
jgi:hypothetical protein